MTLALPKEGLRVARIKSRSKNSPRRQSADPSPPAGLLVGQIHPVFSTPRSPTGGTPRRSGSVRGFWTGSKEHVGEPYLADISVPPGLYAEPALGLEVGTVFSHSDIVRIEL
ncbi:MAG: hypothetical protein MJE77_22450 [Proteobacteria bacterium]|nr:hypothetical protein [Pseudomonadota bacterium]